MMKLVVLSCLLAAASASVLAGIGAPLLLSAPLIAPTNYRGPLSLAPGQPANILAADGRPLDTLEVNLDRSAHLTAKALEGGIHLLKKRSVAPLIAPISPIAPISRITLTGTPLIASGLTGAPLIASGLTGAPLIASGLTGAPLIAPGLTVPSPYAAPIAPLALAGAPIAHGW